jgi:hypothetical protein
MKRFRDVRVLLGGAVLTGAVATLATALSGALTRSPAGEPALVATADAAVPAEPATSLEPSNPAAMVAQPLPLDVRGAAERAPFDPNRRAPRDRYRLPEEFVVEEPPPPPPPPPPAPEFRVLGTIGGPGGGVAVIEVDGEPPRVVSVGDDVMGYSLASIGNRRVTVSKDGRNVSVAMTEAAPTTMAATPANNRGQQQRGGRAQGRGQGQGNAPSRQIEVIRGTPGTQQLQQQIQERVQRALEEARQQREQGRNGGNQGRGGQQQARPRPPGGGD